MDWFKIWPSSYLNVINRISDGAQRGAFSLLLLHCLNDGSLPDDDEEIAYNTGLPVELVTALRPHLKRLAKIEDGRIIISIAADTIKERQEFGAKKAMAGKTGGEARREKEAEAKQVQAREEVKEDAEQKAEAEAVLSSAKQDKAQLSIVKQSQAIQTNKQTDKQTNKGESENPPPPPSAILSARENQPETIAACWQSVFGDGEILGNHRQEQLDAAGIKNLAVFRRVLEIWKTNGHSIRNIAGMVERYGKELEKAQTESLREGDGMIRFPKPNPPANLTPGQLKTWMENWNKTVKPLANSVPGVA